MQRGLSILFTALLFAGCAADEMLKPTESGPVAQVALALSSKGTPKVIDPTVVLTDAIERLVPALGPAGAALGAPLRQLLVSGRLDAQLIDAAKLQLAALAQGLPPESVADANALDFTLDALRAVAGA